MIYSGIEDPAQWVLPRVLEEQAARTPDATWVEMVDGERLSFGAAARDARRVAGYLHSLGVRRGEFVAVMLQNGCDFVRVWQGLGMLGAVAVLLNTELRGAFLSHQLTNSGVRLAIVDGEFVEAVEQAAESAPALARLIVVGEDALGGIARIPRVPWAEWSAAAPFHGELPLPQDTACIMYTSGTSGPAKGVLMPHAHCTLFAKSSVDALDLTDDDSFYIVLPLFHANGLLQQLAACLLMGTRAVVRRRFSASSWLADVRRYEVTVTNTLGVLAAYIAAQPPTADDRRHRLRTVLLAPHIDELDAMFRDRFGVENIVSGFGMTEVNICALGKVKRGEGAAAPVRRKYFDVVVVDPDTDLPVEPGRLGEILVRPKQPFGFMAGYHAMPDRTVEAWRNLWFHTGDAGVMDDRDRVAFVDRIKDCIRRRSENISATEVELVVAGLPGVAEVAAYAVPSDVKGGEDEVMIAIVPLPGAQVSPGEIGAQAEALLPRFARPRFVELMAELPKTATGKVQRAVLRKRGSASAFDRDAEPKAAGR